MIYRMVEFFSNMKLINKLLMLYVITIVMLVGFLSIYTFSELEISAKRRSQEQLQYSCDAFVSDVNFNISNLDGIARSVYENYSLKEYVFEHSSITTEELIYFYDYYIKNLERSKNSNPAVYNIRIFLKNKNFLERWPFVYNESRLNGSLIKQTLESENPHLWAIWPETLIPYRTDTNALMPKDVVSYVTELKHGNEHIGYLEASMEMSLFF